MTGVSFAPRRSVVVEDIRDLERWTQHGPRASGGRLSVLLDLGPLRGFGSVLPLGMFGRRGSLPGLGVLCWPGVFRRFG